LGTDSHPKVAVRGSRTIAVKSVTLVG
jgi:hypothetical protein